jgi:hypothetical protein
MAELDDIKKQINDLNRRIGELGGTFKTNIDAYISSFGNDITAANKALSEMQKIFSNLDTDINYFYSALKNVGKELKGQRDYNKDITKSYSALSSIANKLKYDQDGISTLSKKELQSLQKKVQIQQTDLINFLNRNEEAKKASDLQQNSLQKQLDYYAEIEHKNGSLSKTQQKRADAIIDALDREQKINSKIVETNNEVTSLLTDQEFGIRKLNAVLKERLEEEIKIQKTLGISGKLVDGIVNTLNKLGIDSSFFEGIKEDMREVAKTGTSWQVLMTGIKGLASGIGEALKDPVSQLYILVKVAKFFINAALTANSQVVELGKSLGYAGEQFRSTLVDIERSSNSLFVTTKNLTEAFGELVKTTGFAYEFSADQLETQIKLTKQVGLQADEAAQVQRYSVLTGQTSEQTYKSFLKGLVATRNQLKVGIDFRATLAEAAKVSGQLAANLGFNPERIAQAVVQAKALGLTFDQLKSAASSLLNFESSLENELKAELLTGKQLNLERARAAALQGDQVALAEELAKNIGTASEFTKMNVLQQDALAASVGMTSDQLAETLRKREEALASGKSLQQVTDEEAKKALERASIQDKFNAAVEKLQSLFGNLMAGPLGSFIDMLSSGLNIINDMITPLKVIGSLYLAHVATKKIALGYDIAMNSAARINASLGQSIAATNLVKNQLEKESLITKIAGNVQLFYQLTKEHGLMTALKIQLGLQKATTIEKEKGLLITMKDWLAEKGKVVLMNLQKAGIVILNALKSVGALITKREAIFSIAAAAMSTAKAAMSGIGALLGPLAIPIGIAAAAGVAATGYQLLKGDDIVSEGGYGKRTLFAPEGAIKLNDNDTVIAGTNLNKPTPSPKTPSFDVNNTIIAGTNSNKPSPQPPSIDVSALAESINNMHNTLKQSANKPVVAYINGEDSFAKNIGSNPNLGTSQNINTAYRMA